MVSCPPFSLSKTLDKKKNEVTRQSQCFEGKNECNKCCRRRRRRICSLFRVVLSGCVWRVP